VINNQTYYPYTPNFTSKKWNDSPRTYEGVQTSYSSGVDCVTITQRCASYAGSHYDDGDGLIGATPDEAIQTIAEGRQQWGDPYPSLEHVNSVENAAWLICNDENAVARRLIVPGDIIVCYGTDPITQEEWRHCAIVYKIIDTGVNVKPRYIDNVITIESTGFNMQVWNQRSWLGLYNIGGQHTLSVRRLKFY